MLKFVRNTYNLFNIQLFFPLFAAKIVYHFSYKKSRNMLGDDELELAAAVFTQIGDVLAVIAVQRSICSKNKKTGTT